MSPASARTTRAAMARTRAPGRPHVRSASTAASAPRGARGRCFAPAVERLREAVAIGRVAGSRPAGLVPQRDRTGKLAGASAHVRELLQGAQVAEDDAS